MKKGSTNPELRKLIVELKKTKKPIWKKVASMLEKPRRKRIEVNLWKINKLTKEGDMVIIPGKILGFGELDHKITISSFNASEKAIEKINKNGKYMTIINLTKEKGKIKIMG